MTKCASTPIAELFRAAYRHMDPQTGMFPGTWTCKGCGKSLNADGNHAAELYAGTYTGLCYGCERGPAFQIKTAPDGAVCWSHPPHCPSWRRDREPFWGYAGCPDCLGKGRIMVSRSYSQGGPYSRQCDTCGNRHWRQEEIVKEARQDKAFVDRPQGRGFVTEREAVQAARKALGRKAKRDLMFVVYQREAAWCWVNASREEHILAELETADV